LYAAVAMASNSFFRGEVIEPCFPRKASAIGRSSQVRLEQLGQARNIAFGNADEEVVLWNVWGQKIAVGDVVVLSVDRAFVRVSAVQWVIEKMLRIKAETAGEQDKICLTGELINVWALCAARWGRMVANSDSWMGERCISMAFETFSTMSSNVSMPTNDLLTSRHG
jgi:hypothetical protein